MSWEPQTGSQTVFRDGLTCCWFESEHEGFHNDQKHYHILNCELRSETLLLFSWSQVCNVNWDSIRTVCPQRPEIFQESSQELRSFFSITVTVVTSGWCVGGGAAGGDLRAGEEAAIWSFSPSERERLDGETEPVRNKQTWSTFLFCFHSKM